MEKMRTIKFRGKNTGSGRWIHGAYIPPDCTFWREPSIANLNHRYVIKPESLGQFTGLCDREGKEIYEGDIVKRIIHPELCGQVIFGSSGWVVECGSNEFEINYFGSVKVIGNVFDNPELLEAKND